VTSIDDTLVALQGLNLQQLRYEVETLRATKVWAMTQLGVDYQPGDRVTITSPDPAWQADDRNSGWHPYRESLAVGQTGIAGEITFNASRDRWQTLVGLDRAWSISTNGWGGSARLVRHWRGPAREAPDGYELYDGWEQRHPEGQVKWFAMDARWVALAPDGAA
jgi:hypothetical protein